MVRSRKTEDRSASALQSIVDLHPTMEARIHKCDKELCWDGYLRIYQNNNSLSDKRNYDDDIPIQVKGHVHKESYIDKDRVKESVDIDDLNNYYKTRGCLYFVVIMNEQGNENSVFYSSLYPSKIKEILETAKKDRKRKGERKSVSIPFVRLPEDGERLYLIAKQFSLESNKQGTGRGQIVKNSIALSDIKDVSRISATVFGKTPVQILERIHTGDIVFYGNKGNIEYPVQLPLLSTTVSTIVEQPVYIDSVKYYSSFQIRVVADSPNAKEYRRELTTELKLSDNLSVDIIGNKFKFHFSPVSDLLQIGNDSRFLIALIGSTDIRIGDRHLKTENLEMDDSFYKRLSVFKELSGILEDIKCPISVPYPDLSEDDFICLSQLLQLKNKEVLADESSQLVSYMWWFREKCCPIILCYNTDSTVSITNMISNTKFKAFVLDGEKQHPSIVPNYYSLTPSVLSHLLFYDYEEMYNQVDKTVFNQNTCEGLNELVLNLISAFDICQDEKLLDIARLVLTHLLEFNPKDVAFIINMMQVDYRAKGELSKIQKEKLDEVEKEICRGDASLFNVFSFCKEVLLNNKETATSLYDCLKEEERARVDSFPIMNLYNKLI